MNLDHVFLELSLEDGDVKGMAAVRTDRKGKVLAAVSGKVDDIKEVIITPFTSKFVVVSQYAYLYRPFLLDDFKGKPWLDISQLSWPLGYCDMIPDRDFDTLCKHFGIEVDGPGTMTGNCEALARVYWALMKRYRTSLMGEELIRDVGGETLSKVRRFVGF